MSTAFSKKKLKINKKIQAEACIIILVGMTGIEPVRDLTPAGF